MDLHDYPGAGQIAAANGRERNETVEAVRVTFTLSVSDRDALWGAAAAQALAAPGTRLGDVIEVIGPREDPSIADCIAMLTQPAPMPGCELDTFEIEAIAPEVRGDRKAA